MFDRLKTSVLTFIILLIFDAIWINLFAGEFYAEQLRDIGRFGPEGAFDLRVLPGLGVYVLMTLALEMFVFPKRAVGKLRERLIRGAFLGLCIYGVFDLTNRAILESYPIAMVMVDMTWGVSLFTATTWVRCQLRTQLTFL
ncbi:MAG: DUF2177 family protein [Pseudomonadota bacterium]